MQNLKEDFTYAIKEMSKKAPTHLGFSVSGIGIVIIGLLWMLYEILAYGALKLNIYHDLILLPTFILNGFLFAKLFKKLGDQE